MSLHDIPWREEVNVLFKLNPKNKKGLLVVTTTLQPVNNLAKCTPKFPSKHMGNVDRAVRSTPRQGNKGKGGKGVSGSSKGQQSGVRVVKGGFTDTFFE